MNNFRYYVVALLVMLLTAGIANSQHFTFDNASSLKMNLTSDNNPGSKLLITIGGKATEIDDEVGLFAWESGAWTNCYGAFVITNPGDEAIALTAYGYENVQGTINPGFDPNQEVHFHIYDESTGTTYENVEYEATNILTQANYDNDGTDNLLTFADKAVIKVTYLNAVAPPRAPGNLMPADGDVGIAADGNVTWEDISKYADTYNVQISTDGANPDVANATGLSTNSYAYTGLTNGNFYYWRVQGVHASEGAGDWSAWQQFQVALDTPVLSSPADMTTGFAQEGTLSWNSVNGANNYNWEIYSDAGLSTLVTSGSTGALSVTNTGNAWGLANGTDYWWIVQATNGSNTSLFSSAWKFQVQIGAPMLVSPADLATMVAHPTDFDWDPVAGGTEYEVEISEDNTFGTVNFSQNTVNTAFTQPGLKSWTTYYWRARGIDADGNSGAWSATFQFMTDLTAAMNPLPANNAFGVPKTGNLSWDPVNGADDYVVTLATDMALNNTLPGWPKTVTGTSVAYTVPDFETDYYWNVEVRNAQSTVIGPTWNFESQLDTPVLTSPANMANCQELSLILDWEDFGIVPANGDYYNLQVSTDPAFGSFFGGWNGNAQLTDHEQAITGLANNMTYYWRVAAFKNGQFSGYSPAFSFTTEQEIVMLSMPADFANGVPTANVSVSWNSVPTATTYTLEYDDNAGFSSPQTMNTTSTSTTIGGLNLYTIYYWRVYSDACGADVASEATVRQFQTQHPATTLISPVDGALDQNLSGTLSWNAISGADAYEVQMSTDPTFQTGVYTQTEVSGNTYNYSNIQHSVMHYWRVRGVDNTYGPMKGYGLWSNSFSFQATTLAPPQLTTPANGTAGTLFEVDLFWNTFPTAISYNIQASTDPTFSDPAQMLLDINTPVQTAKVTGLGYDMTVYWRAQSVTAGGTSNWGAPFSFTTIPMPVITGSMDVCENTTHLYTVATDPNIAYTINYDWDVVSGPASIVGDDDMTTVDIEFSGSGTVELKVTRTSPNWMGYDDSYIVNINSNATVDLMTTYTVDTYYPGKACINEPVTFNSVINLPVTSYEWVWIDGVNETVLSTAASFGYQFTAPGTYNIELRTSNPSICGESTYSMNITVEDDCLIYADADDINTCRGSNVTFNTTVWGGDGNYTFSWHPDNNLLNKYTATPTIPNVQASQTYQLVVVDGNGLSKIDYSSVSLTQGPIIKTNTLWIIGGSDAFIDLTTQVKSRSGVAPFTEEWYYMQGGTKMAVNPTNEPTVYGMRVYQVELTDATGCTSNPSKVIVFKRRKAGIPDDAYTLGVNGTGIMAAYPNPVVDKLSVTAEFVEEVTATVKLVDITGKEIVLDNIESKKLYDNELNVSNLSSGVYMLVIETGTDKVVQKIIKK